MPIEKRISSQFDRIQAYFADIPANKYLGLTLVAASEQVVEISMPLKPDYIQEGGVVHGGLISTLADTTAVYLIFPYIPSKSTMASIEFKINFLRPAVLENGDLLARAKIVKKGRKIAVCDVEVLQENNAVARGIFTYLIFEKK